MLLPPFQKLGYNCVTHGKTACRFPRLGKQILGKNSFTHTSQSLDFSSKSCSTLDLRDIQLLTFDVTGTLLTFKKPPFEIYMEFGKKHGIFAERECIKNSFKKSWAEMTVQQPHFGRSWQDWWTEIVMRTFKGAKAQGADDDVLLKKVASQLIEHFQTAECWMLKDGAMDLITALSSKSPQDLRIGIISNFDTRLYEILKMFELDTLFNPIILSHEHQSSKPSKQIFDIALESFKKHHGKDIRPCQACHIGDNYELDYVGAIMAGWKSCLVMSKFNISDIPQTQRIEEAPEVFTELRSFNTFLQMQGKILKSF